MKKTLRSLALLLVVVMLASVSVSAASTSSIWKKASPSLICEECHCKKCICEEETKSVLDAAGKKEYVVTTDGKVLKPASSQGYDLEDGTILVDTGAKVPVSTPIHHPLKPSVGTVICGGKYYPFHEAKDELNKYFEDHTYTMAMIVGQTRALATGANLYSSDANVVTYDAEKGCIVANGCGDAYLYAYTKGGIPFFRLKLVVYPDYTIGLKQEDQLVVAAKNDQWATVPGAPVSLAAFSANGVRYTDVEYVILNDGSADSSVKDGVFCSDKGGAFLVRAYRKSNPKVYGDILILVSTYNASILENCWKPSIDGIVVDKWYGDIFESYKNWYISGWIKSAEGIFIPVVKYEDITIVDDEGNKSTITIAKEEVKSYLQLLKEVYGEELSMKELFQYYAAIANTPFKGMSEEAITQRIIDYKVAIFDRLLEGLLK